MTSISSTGSISSAGIGSGLDVNTIVAKLMEVESLPLTLLQNKASSLNTQVSAIGQLSSLTSAMRDASRALTSPSLWSQTAVSSGDAGAVSASVASGAAAGTYGVSVQALASAQTVASSAFASSTTAVGQGTIQIELGSWSSATPPVFTGKSGATPVTVTIGAGDTSLASIRDKINAANAGVTATIVTDASGARLSLRSAATGAENAFRVTGTEDPADGNTGPGLAALSYDPAAGSGGMTLAQSAGNAQATINGIAVTSASNTLDGVADGLTLTLQKTTTSEVAVNVTPDDGAVTSAVNAFVTAFNNLAGYLGTQTKYDASTKTAGTLQGDRTAVGEQSQLRSVLNQASTADTLYKTLSDVGISMQADGTLKVDSGKLTDALKHRSDLKKLMMGDGDTTAAQGFITRFRNLGDQMLNIDGVLPTRTSSLQSMLKNNGKDQDALQKRLDQTQARLLAQYQALDASMAQLTSTANYLSGQLAALAKSSN